MQEWIANGVGLAWLIIPETRTAEVYRNDQPGQVIKNAYKVYGEAPISGFVLRLERIWIGIQT